MTPVSLDVDESVKSLSFFFVQLHHPSLAAWVPVSCISLRSGLALYSILIVFLSQYC